MDFYYFALCHVCKKPSSTLKKCSSCQVLHYCSRQHQVDDWPKHKPLCKAIMKASKCLICRPNPTKEEYNHFKSSLALLWQCDLERKLDPFEQHMWMFPKICKICYSKEVTIVCPTCLSMAYCSEEHSQLHRETHEKWCQNLKLRLAFDNSNKDLSVIECLVKFKIGKIPGESLPCNMAKLVEMLGMKFLGTPYKSDHLEKHIIYLHMSDFFCRVANMAYALEKSNFIEKRCVKKNKLVIHMVGCDIAETLLPWHFLLEFLSHWITNLKHTTIYAIGPNFDGDFNVTLPFAHHCSECAKKNYTGTIKTEHAFYHDVISSISKPDLVVAFNSGLHEFISTEKDTWEMSIPSLIHYKNVPTLLTAYTDNELQKDVARFEEFKVKFIVEPQKNPYASLIPFREWEEGNEPIYFEHSYMSIITKNN